MSDNNNPVNNPTPQEVALIQMAEQIKVLTAELTKLKTPAEAKEPVNELEAVKQERLKTEEIEKRARVKLENDLFAKAFDDTFSQFIDDKSLLADINSEAVKYNDTHKMVLKFQEIFKAKHHLDLLPPSQQNRVNTILKLNHTDTAHYDNVAEIRDILTDFVPLYKKAVERNIIGNNGDFNKPKENLITQRFLANPKIAKLKELGII
jgi:hypothetical protein